MTWADARAIGCLSIGLLCLDAASARPLATPPAAISAAERQVLRDAAEARRVEFTKHYHALQQEIAGTPGDLYGRMVERRGAIMRLLAEFLADAEQNRIANDNGIVHSFGRWVSHDPELEELFLASIRQSTNYAVKRYAQEHERFVRLMRKSSAELALTAFDGTELDLQKLRGKVVLVNIWSLNCSSCRAAMPKEQAVYARYREQGFEIFGICLFGSVDPDAEKAKNILVLEAEGVTWPSGMLSVAGANGGRVLEEFHRKLASFGPPETATSGLYFLLDQQGRLVSTDISGQWLEFEVRKLLGLPPLKAG